MVIRDFVFVVFSVLGLSPFMFAIYWLVCVRFLVFIVVFHVLCSLIVFVRCVRWLSRVSCGSLSRVSVLHL